MAKRMANRTANMAELSHFEQETSSTENRKNYELDNENAIEFLKDEQVATVTFSQGRFISKIKKLAEKYPSEVQIVHENKSSIVAHVPVSYFIPRRPKEVSEAQKEAARERFTKMRRAKASSMAQD